MSVPRREEHQRQLKGQSRGEQLARALSDVREIEAYAHVMQAYIWMLSHSAMRDCCTEDKSPASPLMSGKRLPRGNWVRHAIEIRGPFRADYGVFPNWREFSCRLAPVVPQLGCGLYDLSSLDGVRAAIRSRHTGHRAVSGYRKSSRDVLSGIVSLRSEVWTKTDDVYG